MASVTIATRNERTPDAYRQLLLEVSTFFHPDPEVSYQFVADRLSAFYNGATAAITLHQGAQIAFKYVANPPEWAIGLCGVPTEDAYCARTLRSNQVTLIQDVRRDSEFCGFQTVELGWTRYLGAPIRDNRGQPIGTLCIIDGSHDEVLSEADKELVALLAQAARVKIQQEHDLRLPHIEADSNQLEHMLVNLALNGIKAMTPLGGGTLTIRLRRQRRTVCIEVSDTGPGVPESMRSCLFEPFATTQGDGFGLGLFSVKRTVDMHNGRIEVRSIAGQGATFEICLPIRQPATGGQSHAAHTRRGR